MRKLLLLCLFPAIIFTSCTRTAPERQVHRVLPTAAPLSNAEIPTAASIETYLPPTRLPGAPIVSPTPDGGVAVFPTFTPLAEPVSPFNTPTPGPLSYTVKPGETLFSIGRLYGVNPYSIAAANNIAYPYIIYPGQQLVIPTAPTPTFTPGPGGSAAPATTATPVVQYPPVRLLTPLDREIFIGNSAPILLQWLSSGILLPSGLLKLEITKTARMGLCSMANSSASRLMPSRG